MFKQRLITALILIPLVFLSLYYATLPFFVGLTAVIMLACGLEWQQLIPITSTRAKISFLTYLLLAGYLLHWIANAITMQYWLLAGLAVWLLLLVAIWSFPKSQAIWGKQLVVTALAILLLPLFAECFIRIYQQPQGKAFIIYLLLLVWGADIGGYFAGKLWGQHRLIPNVSPKKTFEGLLGGMVLSLVVAGIAFCYFTPPQSLLLWLGVAVFIFIMSLIGDLFISMLKRRVQIKDTGTIFPGHGGILDRLDSLIAATPAFYFMLFVASQGMFYS